MLQAAAVTCYAFIAIVPALLVGVRLATAVVGVAELHRLAAGLVAALPNQIGAASAARLLVERGSHLSVGSTLLAALPASLFGEGLRRAFADLTGHRERLVGWRGRLRVLPVFVLLPGYLLALFAVAGAVSGPGMGMLALTIYVTFLVDWVGVSLLLVYVYRVVSPATPPLRAVLISGFVTGSFLAGFLHGFVLFVALPLDLGAPFGGVDAVGVAVAVLLWLWLLSAMILGGYQLTRVLAVRLQVRHRVDRGPVDAHLEMQVRAGR
jgi:membrane protein